jgi:preprotein translocase subunit YajC
MKDAAVLILALYALVNAGIIYYFFVYRQRQIDKEYAEAMEKISSHGYRPLPK